MTQRSSLFRESSYAPGLLVENDERDEQGPPTYEGKPLRHFQRSVGIGVSFPARADSRMHSRHRGLGEHYPATIGPP